MRLALISDLHGNLEATQAVLADTKVRGIDELLCLGDVVGYGPDPEACLEIVRERCAACVLGNHDEAVVAGDGTGYLPEDGRRAAMLHHEWLSDDQIDWLRSLPYVLQTHGVTLAHASPGEPDAWLRLDTFQAVRDQFAHFETDVCFVGHSHKPAVASATLGVMKVRPGHRYLVNVGSVGQPRDHDPRAAYGLFDTETMAYELVRVHYDIARTQSKITDRGLPSGLSRRLSRGV
jgi:diadenosine tetraphosphatase ApaH/serine/threonine PP2A family protein phosphatase